MDSSSPSLLDELEKYEYKKSAPNSNSPAFVESKMKALIGREIILVWFFLWLGLISLIFG